MVRTQEGPVLYVCTKYQADSSIRSNVIRGSYIINNNKTANTEDKNLKV